MARPEKSVGGFFYGASMNASITIAIVGRAVRVALYPMSWHIFMQGPSDGLFNIAVGPLRFMVNYGRALCLERPRQAALVNCRGEVMTRDEFTRYAFSGVQWTKETAAAAGMLQVGMIPTCDVDTFEREICRPDGLITVRRIVENCD